MATVPTSQNSAAPSWNGFRVTVFGGQHDSHIDIGEDYRTIALASLFDRVPQSKSKMAGDAFLASTYNSYDARSHEAQRQHGEFVALVADIDKGDLDLSAIKMAAQAFADGSAWLAYSSAHSRDGDQRWRMVFPLSEPCRFEQWFDAQSALFTFLESSGIPVDHALSRAGQPIYLPNVPEAHKDGTPLRDAAGEPIYYQTAHSGIDVPGVDLRRGIVAGGIAAIRQKRAADDREREALKAEAARRFAEKPRPDSANIITTFNTSTDIATMLTLCDYKQSPRNADDWRSPQQSGETYATRVIDGKWISLSESDASSGLGHKCRTGCFGDAYDLYVHYKHKGDHKEAYRTLGREFRPSNVVQGNFRGDDQDPGYQEVPDWVITGDAEPDYEAADAIEQAAISEDHSMPGAVNVDDWVGRRAPDREFVVHGWIARGHAGLLSGMEGVGKSLAAQQLATCVAVGIPFLGLTVEQTNTAYITCEDDKDELWRRQEAINAMLGITMADLKDKLFLRSWLGEQNNELGTFDVAGRITVSERFKQVEWEADKYEQGFMVLDNAAHLFSGNENARHDVAAFLGLLERLSQRRNGAALLLAHPNKQFAQGNSQGNEYSGSTGWSAHVRNRLFLDYRGKPEDGSPADDDERILRKSKANYGKRGEEIVFRWQDWAFVRPEDLGQDRARQIAEINLVNAENERFIECLKKKISERVNVSVRSAASNYAPRVFAKMPSAGGMKVEQFERAMERLLHLEIIVGEGGVFQRGNRVWAMGIVMNGGAQTPSNSAQSAAQSPHKAAHKPCTDPASTTHKAALYTPLPPKGGTLEGVSPQGDDPENWNDNPALGRDYGPDDWGHGA